MGNTRLKPLPNSELKGCFTQKVKPSWVYLRKTDRTWVVSITPKRWPTWFPYRPSKNPFDSIYFQFPWLKEVEEDVLLRISGYGYVAGIHKNRE
jgi:predicted component of type VI protein secretion system